MTKNGSLQDSGATICGKLQMKPHARVETVVFTIEIDPTRTSVDMTPKMDPKLLSIVALSRVGRQGTAQTTLIAVKSQSKAKAGQAINGQAILIAQHKFGMVKVVQATAG